MELAHMYKVSYDFCKSEEEPGRNCFKKLFLNSGLKGRVEIVLTDPEIVTC